MFLVTSIIEVYLRMTKCKPLSAANLELEGPELFSPGTHGSIIPNFSATAPGTANGGSNAITINQHFAPNFARNAATREELSRWTPSPRPSR